VLVCVAVKVSPRRAKRKSDSNETTCARRAKNQSYDDLPVLFFSFLQDENSADKPITLRHVVPP
jgi:hypothetical protein